MAVNTPPPSPGQGTVIGSGTEVKGAMDIDHPVRVHGRLSGRLRTSASLVVGEEGLVEAEKIEVREAEIHGRVSGRIVAGERVCLAATARFRGSATTPLLVIEEGAQVEYSPPEDFGPDKPAAPASTGSEES